MRLLTSEEIADGLFDSDTVLALQKRIAELEAQLDVMSRNGQELYKLRQAVQALDVELARLILSAERLICADHELFIKVTALLKEAL